MSTLEEDMAELNSLTQEDGIIPKHRGTSDEVATASPSKFTANAKLWSVYGDSVYAPCEKTSLILPPGQYIIERHPDIGIHFMAKSVNLDNLLRLPDSASDEIILSVESFWKKEEKFREFGFLWKRGILLWGPPGSGKTSTLQIISKNIIDKGGISVYVTNPARAAQGLEVLRKIEPKRPIVVMLEDVDAIINQWGEADLLALLDGELQIDNVVFIATTNYPDRLDKRFVNRPSRFDLVQKIDMPSPEARELYIKTKNVRLANPANVFELKKWVDRTKGFSIAHIKELIVSVEVFDVDFNQAASRLESMHRTPALTDDNQFGFIKK